MIIANVLQLFLINKMLKSNSDKTELKESYTAWTISNYKIFREKLISNDPNKCFSRLAWKDERFIFHIIRNNRQDLEYGPPSFNENKKILLKVINYYPEYYYDDIHSIYETPGSLYNRSVILENRAGKRRTRKRRTRSR